MFSYKICNYKGAFWKIVFFFWLHFDREIVGKCGVAAKGLTPAATLTHHL